MKLIALLSWIDGFGADTMVKGIFYSLEEARKHARLNGDNPDRYQVFKIGKVVHFDWYNANDFPPKRS